MNLQTTIDGISKGLTEPFLGMNHLVFCLLMGLVLLTLRKKPLDIWWFLIALAGGFALEWVQPIPPILVNVVIPVTVVFALLQQWFYEKLAAYTIPILLIGGLFHGLSYAQSLAGSSLSGFVAFAGAAILVQGLMAYGFGLLCRMLSLKSPDGYEGLENILSAVGAGVALAYFVLAF